MIVAILATGLISCSNQNQEPTSTLEMSPDGRGEYEYDRLKDPVTGKIPDNIRVRELAFASTVPKTFTKTNRASAQIFEPIGPRNVGGRTRAISFDIDMPNIVLAGGVSGGMWRSVDYGNSWNRVTNFEDQSAVSCMMQDTRTGKSSNFYYGSGESIGNSASKSFSANFNGSGMYKSTDHGATWTHISSTSVQPQKGGDFKYIFNVAIDVTRSDSTIIYAATPKGIRRSNDDGATWQRVLGGFSAADYTNIIVTSTGAHYATISSDGSQSGFWRSDDGLNWVQISPLSLPTNHQNTKLAVAPSNPNVVYYYTVTPNAGLSDVSFWKYTYISGTGAGSGGVWDNRSNSLPPAAGYSLNTQGSYCMSLAVKPDNENVVFLGGTNLFRSLNGFGSTSQMRQIGGYGADGYPNFDYYKDNQHPDQQSLVFLPGDPNQLLAGTDGGLHFTSNCLSSKVIWQSFNNGYQTTQFYGMGIDHYEENERVVSGFQDNGSWWTKSANTSAIWKFTLGGDGAYCAIEGGGTGTYYFSSQYGYIRQVKLDTNGNVNTRKNIRPSGLNTGWSFNHPFILDPADNKKMYLPNSNSLWRNEDLSGFDIQGNWTKIASVSGSSITAVDASLSEPGIVYVGTRNTEIFRIEDDGTNTATVTNITAGITKGGYTSNIAVDPNDADRLIVIYSNYNTISGWYTEDAGANWKNIEGNLVGDTDPGVPPSLSYLGNGPSFRWARFVPTDYGTVVLLGTSIGLFATNDMDQDTIQWIQQASDVIGNVVVEQIDHRISDGFCVVSTHGAGAYKTYFENNFDITSVKNVQVDKLKMVTYPNPVQEQLNIDFILSTNESVVIDVMNVNGQVIQTKLVSASSGKNTHSVNTSKLSTGMYYVTIRSNSGTFTKAIVKN